MEDENNNGSEIADEAFTELEPVVQEEDKKAAATQAESCIELQPVEKAGTLGVSSKLLSAEQGSEKEVETLAGTSNKLDIVEQETTYEPEIPVEASIQPEPPAESSKAGAKMVNRSSAKSMLNARKGKAALKMKKKIVKRIKRASIVIEKSGGKIEEAESTNKLVDQQNKGAEAPAEVSTQLQTFEKETEKEAELPTETSVQAEEKAPPKKTPNSLKARAIIAKKSSSVADGKAVPNRVQKKNATKNKGVSLVLNEGRVNSEETRERASNDNPQMGGVTGGTDSSRDKNKAISHNEDRSGKKPASDDINGGGKMQNQQEKDGKIKRKQKKRKNAQSRNSNEGLANLEKKEKLDNLKGDQGKKSKDKKERTGGLIFMCSSKTKPDCLNYRVMGVPESQKDMVLGVKPGLKLFLYDFDLKLMYGIYKASSAGGKKLEPRAFGGAFPYQVRFKIISDCFPVPESIFKKAMTENYISRHKFKKELNFKQVRKLTALFRPVEVHPSVQPRVDNLPASSARNERARDGDGHLHARGSQRHSQRRPVRTDPYAGRYERRDPLLPYGRDQHISNREARAQPDRDMFLTEKEYRAYGLRGERRDRDLPSRAAPPVDPYWEEYERRRQLSAAPPVDSYWEDYERRRQSHADYRDAVAEVPAYRERSHAGPSYSAYLDYRTTDSFDTRREYPPADRYLDYHRRPDVSLSEAYMTEPDQDVRRREFFPADGVYSHADYDLMRRYRVMDPDPAALPVSSRYSFAGPR